MSDCFSKLAKNTGMQEILSSIFFSNMYLHTWCEMKVEAVLVRCSWIWKLSEGVRCIITSAVVVSFVLF